MRNETTISNLQNINEKITKAVLITFPAGAVATALAAADAATAATVEINRS